MIESFDLAVIHDNSLLRADLKLSISKSTHIHIVFEASTGYELITELKKRHLDMVFLGGDVMAKDGPSIVSYLRDYYPEIKICMLTLGKKRRARKQTKNNTIHSDSASADLRNITKAINELSKNEDSIVYVSKTDSLRAAPQTHLLQTQLSERELQIIQLISKELTNKEIAERLCVSIRTIDGHKERIMEKTNTKNTIGILMFAIKSNLLEA